VGVEPIQYHNFSHTAISWALPKPNFTNCDPD